MLFVDGKMGGKKRTATLAPGDPRGASRKALLLSFPGPGCVTVRELRSCTASASGAQGRAKQHRGHRRNTFKQQMPPLTSWVSSVRQACILSMLCLTPRGSVCTLDVGTSHSLTPPVPGSGALALLRLDSFQCSSQVPPRALSSSPCPAECGAHRLSRNPQPHTSTI